MQTKQLDSSTHAVDHSPFETHATALLDVAGRANELGLKPQHVFVLAALVESAALVDGDPNTAMAIWEIAKRAALSQSQVKAAIAVLTSGGYIARKQTARRAGIVAVTVVSRAAYELFGAKGGAAIGGSHLPPEFGPLLVGEAAETIDAIAAAYREGTMPAPDVAAAFRGGAVNWSQITFLLQGRVEVEAIQYVQRTQEALSEQQERERGEHRLSLASGEALVILDPDRNVSTAERFGQGKFVRDVLSRVIAKSPNAVTMANVRELCAEVMYARTVGFVYSRDYIDAERIIASLIVRGTWSAPRGIEPHWYATGSACVAPQARALEHATHH